MNRLIGIMTLIACFTVSGYCNATVEDVKDDGTYTIGPGGCVDS